jgi:hypothetical protein
MSGELIDDRLDERLVHVWRVLERMNLLTGTLRNQNVAVGE